MKFFTLVALLGVATCDMRKLYDEIEKDKNKLKIDKAKVKYHENLSTMYHTHSKFDKEHAHYEVEKI